MSRVRFVEAHGAWSNEIVMSSPCSLLFAPDKMTAKPTDGHFGGQVTINDNKA